MVQSDVVKGLYVREVQTLSAKESGYHFSVLNTSVEQLEEFDIDVLGKGMEVHAPMLWNLLDRLLSARRKGQNRGHGNSGDPQVGEDDVSEDEEALWEELGDLDLEEIVEGLEGNMSKKKNRIIAQRNKLTTIKKVIILSILMQSSNRNSNALQSIVGIFLQSVHTPQKVIDTLSKMGVSVSVDAINAAVLSLSAESHRAIHALDTLVHLTSGLLFPLQHGVTREDLRCSITLWEKSPLNLQLNPSTVTAKGGWKDLLRLHPDSLNAAGLSRRDRFNSWKILSDLINYGPLYFRQFKDRLGDPETVDSIPVTKTPILAARVMHLSNSTVSGNISSVVELLRQGGIEDPDEIDDPDMPDMSEYVVLFHGDLGSGERLQAAQQRRSIEDTHWKRLQHVVFIPGLFHLKMAGADAIWRTFLQQPSARDDENALMHDVAILRPKETGIYGSKPGFRHMHELVTYDGICRRLDCWRVEAKKQNTLHVDLDAYAASEPLFDELKTMADQLAQTYITNHGLRRTRSANHSQRDEQYENGLLLNRYFLLYEELSYAMNSGDIGRVETCIVGWILIFKATGKHNRHAEVDMTQTFKQLCKYIAEHSPHEHTPGRHSKYSIPDLFSKGQELLDKMEDGAEGAEDQLEAMLEDLVVELGV
ncbi:hypothetical protein DEU56DRAFT_928273 [Suillus clintonianus]|uniref:uncharacterized protein n=1 Tax=Suillus clintonianus TaxID=1904413 RepID=UPI001B864DB1|nr:uncharacterized protein DEU56DRAFT_928273 [Suillus clintonianus]KAG2148116.1 hypothetical protein DEU56DRAFT_928273 [Suillus clintonianus]